MTQVTIENPIINSAYDEPTRHYRFAEEGITNKIVEGRRSSTSARTDSKARIPVQPSAPASLSGLECRPGWRLRAIANRMGPALASDARTRRRVSQPLSQKMNHLPCSLRNSKQSGAINECRALADESNRFLEEVS